MPSRQRPDEIERAVLALSVPAGCRMVVAVSGGPDSVTLLDALVRAVRSGQRRWELKIVHVNHQLRGEESAEDERFVSDLASLYGLPLDVRRIDTNLYAAERHLSPEAAAREARYAALRQTLTDWHGDVVCTAHTRDDQAETVMLRLVRGAGVEGLAGMPAHTDWLLRPLLSVSRTSVRRYLAQHGLQYRTDSSNADLRRARNRVRAEVLPSLESINPGAVGVITRSAGLLAHDAGYLAQETEEVLATLEPAQEHGETSANVHVWRALHPALRRSSLRRLLALTVGSLHDVSADHVLALESALLASASGPVLAGQLPHTICAYVDGGRFALRQSARPHPLAREAVSFDVPGEIETSSGRLVARILDEQTANDLPALLATRGPLHALCDLERTGVRLTARSRRPGDRIALFDSGGTRKLQDVLVDHKVPRDRRDEVVVVDNGRHVVWVPGYAVDGRTAARADARRALHLKYHPVNGLLGAKMLGTF